MLDRTVEYEKMAQAEASLWWYRALHTLVFESLNAAGVSNNAAILDAGCGTGGLMAFLRARGYARVQGFDLSADAVAWCRRRNLDVEQHDLQDVARAYPAAAFDAVISNDTLYFFDRTACPRVLAQLASVVRKDGVVLLNLPALDAFRGIHDVSVGITRRFSKPYAQEVLQAANLVPVRIVYWPFLLSPAIYLTRLLQRMKMARDPDFEVVSDVMLPPAWVNRLLERISVWENRHLRFKPFGSSLFLVLRKGET